MHIHFRMRSLTIGTIMIVKLTIDTNWWSYEVYPSFTQEVFHDNFVESILNDEKQKHSKEMYSIINIFSAEASSSTIINLYVSDIFKRITKESLHLPYHNKTITNCEL